MRLSPDERAVLRDNLSDLVWLWAVRLVDSGVVPAPPPSAGPTDEDARAAAHLARLAAIEEIRRSLADLSAYTAEEAALYGADYRRLAEAAGIRRNAVRRRWPRVARIIKGRRPAPPRDLDEVITRFKVRLTDGRY